MSQIFKKRQQYRQLSSKFKDHFNQRQQKFSLVNSNDLKIEQKMKIFKQLINDDRSLQKKRKGGIKLSYLKEIKQIKPNQHEQKQINALIHMTDGLTDWQNMKQQKKKVIQNPFTWQNYKQEKQERKQKQNTQFKQILKQKLNLKQCRLTHRLQRVYDGLNNKMRSNVLSFSASKPFRSTGRNTVSRGNFLTLNSQQITRKKSKLTKYFREMKQFNCHNKHLSGTDNSKLFSSQNTSQLFTSKDKIERISRLEDQLNQKTNQLRRNQTLIQIFKDDSIYERMKFIQDRNQNMGHQKLEIISKNSHQNDYKLLKKLQSVEKMPQNLLRQAKFGIKTHSTQKQKVCPQNNQKSQFDIKKLKAVKKIKCI